MSTKVRSTSDLVDYKKAKVEFLQLVDNWLGNQKNRELYDIHSKEYKKYVINEISKLKEESPYPEYEVIRIKGENVLLMKRNRTDDNYVRVLDWEEMFDLIMPLHEKSGHKGRQDLMKMIGKAYKYPSMCLTFFKRVCNICTKKDCKRRQKLLSVSALASVFVINMVQMRMDEKFRYLLIYVCKETNFVILRPLVAKTDIEITTELFKIFTQFGPPLKLNIHGYNTNLTMKIESGIKELCPEFKHIHIMHKPVSFDLPTIVTDKIQDWMKTTKSDIWEVGCCVVQRQMNCDPKMSINKHDMMTPHSQLFKTYRSKVRDGRNANTALKEYQEKELQTSQANTATKEYQEEEPSQTNTNTLNYHEKNLLTSQTSISDDSQDDIYSKTVRDIVEAQIRNSYAILTTDKVVEYPSEYAKFNEGTSKTCKNNSTQLPEHTVTDKGSITSNDTIFTIDDESLDSVQSTKTECIETNANNAVIPIRETIIFEVESDIEAEIENNSMDDNEDPLSFQHSIPEDTNTVSTADQDTEQEDVTEDENDDSDENKSIDNNDNPDSFEHSIPEDTNTIETVNQDHEQGDDTSDETDVLENTYSEVITGAWKRKTT